MGLFDKVLGGMFGSDSQSGSSMSPLVKALLALLAAKAATSYFSKPAAGTADAPTNDGTIQSGMLQGLPNLDTILDKLKGAGHADVVQSWIGHGPNQPIPPSDLQNALGPETVDELQKQSGIPRDQLMGQLSSALPQVVDKLTLDGRLPGPEARDHW